MNNRTLIELNDVYFSYSRCDEILKGINFKLNKGDYSAILGTSGSGKSTLLSLLGLINKPSRGRCLILGQDMSELTDESIAKLKTYEIGFIYQNFNLLNHLSVLDNVTLPLTYNSSVTRKKYKEKALEALHVVSMQSYATRTPTELSGGQQQRVAIARALVNNPSILFADEPTGNLDSKNSDSIYELFERLNCSGKTICLITHDKSHASLAKCSYHISDGMISNKYEN